MGTTQKNVIKSKPLIKQPPLQKENRDRRTPKPNKIELLNLLNKKR